MDAAATPLPKEETTPPVTKIYFGPIRAGYAPLNGLPGAKLCLFLLGSRCTTHFTETAAACQRAPVPRRECDSRSPASAAARVVRCAPDRLAERWQIPAEPRGGKRTAPDASNVSRGPSLAGLLPRG